VDVTAFRQDIFFSPLTVGAYYLNGLNLVVIPAAYLQAPYYDPAADMATNFGALGTTLGHEIGHAFDDQGSKRGPHGQLENWWTADDRARFDALGEALSDQFADVEVVPGMRIDTALTLGENLSDLAGVTLALDALREAKAAREEGADLTPEDLRAFFTSYAIKRRTKRLFALQMELAGTDTHSPPADRVNRILPHIDAWYDAFGVTEGHALWIPPDERVRIW